MEFLLLWCLRKAVFGVQEGVKLNRLIDYLLLVIQKQLHHVENHLQFRCHLALVQTIVDRCLVDVPCCTFVETKFHIIDFGFTITFCSTYVYLVFQYVYSVALSKAFNFYQMSPIYRPNFSICMFRIFSMSVLYLVEWCILEEFYVSLAYTKVMNMAILYRTHQNSRTCGQFCLFNSIFHSLFWQRKNSSPLNLN